MPHELQKQQQLVVEFQTEEQYSPDRRFPEYLHLQVKSKQYSIAETILLIFAPVFLNTLQTSTKNTEETINESFKTTVGKIIAATSRYSSTRLQATFISESV